MKDKHRVIIVLIKETILNIVPTRTRSTMCPWVNIRWKPLDYSHVDNYVVLVFILYILPWNDAVCNRCFSSLVQRKCWHDKSIFFTKTKQKKTVNAFLELFTGSKSTIIFCYPTFPLGRNEMFNGSGGGLVYLFGWNVSIDLITTLVVYLPDCSFLLTQFYNHRLSRPTAVNIKKRTGLLVKLMSKIYSFRVPFSLVSLSLQRRHYTSNQFNLSFLLSPRLFMFYHGNGCRRRNVTSANLGRLSGLSYIPLNSVNIPTVYEDCDEGIPPAWLGCSRCCNRAPFRPSGAIFSSTKNWIE